MACARVVHAHDGPRLLHTSPTLHRARAARPAPQVDDKYAFMAAVQPSENQGAADAAWDD